MFRRLWFGALAASAGQWMQQIALGWLAIVMTSSPAFVGIVAFAAGLPFIVIAPLGGVLIDWLDRRRLMLACQFLACLLAAVMAVDVMGGFVQSWHLPLAAFLNGALQALLSPTQQSLVPSLVPRHDLTNAIGLMSAGQNMTRVVGPSIAGITIGSVGVGATFLAQALAIAASIVMVFGIVLQPRTPSAVGGRGNFAGIRLVASRPDLRGLLLLVAIPMFFVFPYIGFLNIFARDILGIGAEGLGLLMAVSGCGAVVMSGNNALVQHRVSDEVRGRVMGAYMLTWGLMPLGSLPMGMIADRVGTPTAVAAGAVASSILAVALGFSAPAIREI